MARHLIKADVTTDRNPLIYCETPHAFAGLLLAAFKKNFVRSCQL